MRKSWKSFLFVASLAFVALFAACDTEEDPQDDPNDDPNGEETETVEVHFYNSEGWDEVYVQSDDHEDLTDGLQATAESGEDKWYAVEFERDVLRNPITITFTDGGDNESEPLEINHPRQVYTTIYSDGIFGSRGGAEDFMNTTLYFYNSEGWDAVHASSDDVAMLSDNPTVDAMADQENWYSIQVPVNLSKSSISVTFNDGTVANGTELTLDDPERTYLTIQEDGIYGGILEAEAKVSGNFTEVYFYNTAGWEQVSVYYWDHDNLESVSWPGVSTADIDREGWVKAIIPGVNPGDEFKIIFNNGGNGSQTGDTVISNADELYLRYNEPVNDENVPAGKYTSFEEAENPSTEVEYYNDQGWDTVTVDAVNSEGTALEGVTITQQDDSMYWTVEIPQSVMDDNTVELTFSDGDAASSDAITLSEDNINSILTSSADVTYTARTTVWFYNSAGWTTVEANASTTGDTPRTMLDSAAAMQDGDTAWYSVEMPTNFDNEDYEITFTNGTDSSEAVTLTDGSELYLTMTATERYSTLNEANAWMDAEAADLTKVWFYNSEGWTDIHAYNWSNGSMSDTFNEVLGAWPGRAATQDGDTDWWYVEVPVDFTQDFVAATDDEDAKGFNIIFNGDGGQTGNVLLENMTDIYITADSEKFDNQADAEQAMIKTEIWFYNSEGWDTVHATAVAGSETVLDGAAATQDGDTDWWSIEVPVDIATTDFDITFSDGADATSSTMSLTSGDQDLLYTMDGTTYDSRMEAEIYYGKTAEDMNTIWFYNSEGWTNINAYAFGDYEAFGGWPGTAATQDGTTDWWSVEIPLDFTTTDFTVIFNGSLDGSDVQTGNIALEDNTNLYITVNDEKFDSKAAAEGSFGTSGATDLFISEYIEGSGSNKAIEIYNGTGAEVDLSNYSFKLYSNGSDVSEQGYTLSGTLADGETYVSVNPSADQALLDLADYTGGYPDIVANYNGNDAIELLKNGTVIDVFGEVGVDTVWTVDTGSTEDNTLVRKASVTGPTTTWDPAEWDVYPQDTFEHLGSHTMN